MASLPSIGSELTHPALPAYPPPPSFFGEEIPISGYDPPGLVTAWQQAAAASAGLDILLIGGWILFNEKVGPCNETFQAMSNNERGIMDPKNSTRTDRSSTHANDV